MNNSLTLNDDFFSDEYDQSDNIICSDDTESTGSLFDKLKHITSVSEVLRIFGACAVIASMSIFMLNGWSDGNDIQRYLKLLAQTGLLTGAGIALSFVLKENKGARLFFGLSLISVVANFTILGALTYSMFQLDGGLIDYPSMVTWRAVNATSFWPVFAGAVTLLALLTRFSFSIFARNIAAPLSLHFLALSSLLLIPARSSLIVCGIAIAALWVAYNKTKKLSKNEKVVLTNETKFALGLMFIPGLLIIARAISLYNVDEVMLLTVSGLAYFSIRSWLTRFTDRTIFQSILEKVQFFIGVFLSLQLVGLIPNSLYQFNGAIFSIAVIALSVDQIKHANSLTWQKLILNMTTFGLVVISIGLAFFSNGILIQTSSLLTCIGLLYFANTQLVGTNDSRFSIVTSVIGIIAAVLFLATHVIAAINLGNWVVIGLIGATLIIGGSLYERFGLSLTTGKR